MKQFYTEFFKGITLIVKLTLSLTLVKTHKFTKSVSNIFKAFLFL